MKGNGSTASFSLFQRGKTFDPIGIFRQMLAFSFIILYTSQIKKSAAKPWVFSVLWNCLVTVDLSYITKLSTLMCRDGEAFLGTNQIKAIFHSPVLSRVPLNLTTPNLGNRTGSRTFCGRLINTKRSSHLFRLDRAFILISMALLGYCLLH